MKRLPILLLLLICLSSSAAEVIPPAPARYFNDYAGVVSSATATTLNQALENFEKESSGQILVAVFPKMQSDSSVEDYTVRVARAWRAGQVAKNNGSVLFVFVQDHQVYLQVGYGLEAVLPDALCKRIIEDEINPRFRAGDFDGGLTAGVQAIIAATKGEYKGTGRTTAEGRGSANAPGSILFGVIVVCFILFVLMRGGMRRRGYSRWGGGGWTLGGGGWSGGGGGWSGGGGGGFSGGGGSFGGGGAGGKW